MSNLKRFFYTGNIYFITTITKHRDPTLCKNIDLLKRAFNNTYLETPFRLISWVILPDHLHIILDPGKSNPADIMQRFKMSFGQYYRKRNGLNSGSIWQKRYWDHVIRTEQDLINHMIYIYHNPVKHRLTDNPENWPHSSSHEFSDKESYEYDESDFGDCEGGFGE